MSGRFVVSVLKNAVFAVLPFWIVLALTKILSDGPRYDHQGYHISIVGIVFLLPLLWGIIFGNFLDEKFEDSKSKNCFKYHAYWYYFLCSNLIYFIHWAFRDSHEYIRIVREMYSERSVVSLWPNIYFVSVIVFQGLIFVVTLTSARRSLERTFNAN